MASISTLGQQMDQVIRLKSMQMQLGVLQNQVATEKKTQLFKGLGTDVILSKRARADVQRLETYIQNIDRGNIRINQMTSGISAIQKQVNDVIDSVVNQTQKGDVELDFIRRLAENTYDFLLDKLNLKDGDAYVFAGSDTSTRPVSDTGALDAYFADLNAEWAAGTLTINPPNTIYSRAYGIAERRISPSFPSISQAAVAMAMLCGLIILPPVAPVVLAATSQFS